MLFNSWIFFAFLALVLPPYWLLPRRAQNVLLLVASYVFYGWWDWRFLGLLAFSTAVDFTMGRLIESGATPRRRRTYLVLSLSTNLGILATFKYFGFFATSLQALAARAGLALDLPTLHVVLPIGVSFYTFQSMSYTVDVYRRLLPASRKFLEFALFVSFFPQLVAGPIQRATDLLPQVQRPRTVDDERILSALGLMLVGYVKKVGIADLAAPQVEWLFTRPGTHAPLDLLVGMHLFALQIYCDFSGYSDIARGVARLLGFELSVNFRRPYLAPSITEFWRRWHISLSTWLRDYLYIPLGGNRGGRWATFRNLFITMLLGGLWHGANWTFVIWGGLHGLYLAVHKAWREAFPRGPTVTGAWRERLRTLAGIVATYHLVLVAWVFFRAGSFAQALEYLSGLFHRSASFRTEPLGVLVAGVLALIVVEVPEARLEARGLRPWSVPILAAGAYAGAMLVLLLVLGDQHAVPFIYFQF